jgi:tRNA(Leu) C34 or U34 (ribose-2'-O)-methylase TrmL
MSHAPDLSGFTRDEICDALDEVRQPVSIAIYGSKNEFNIGGMIRTAHNFLVRDIHLVEVEWFYEKGALSTLKYEKRHLKRWSTLESFLEGMKGRNLISFERRENLDSYDIRSFRYPENPVLFFGSEKTGVPDAILEASRSVVSIPILGLNNDHNVTVSCAIALYDWFAKNCKA